MLHTTLQLLIYYFAYKFIWCKLSRPYIDYGLKHQYQRRKHPQKNEDAFPFLKKSFSL